MMFSINTVFVTTALFSSAQAFSTGAGGCDGGGAAVRGFHLTASKTIATGSLADGGVGLYLEGALLNPTTVTNFTASNLNILSLNGTSDYRGLLVRLSSDVNASTVLLEITDDLKEADVCTAPVSGLTHSNGDLKNNQAMSLFLAEGNLTLDVTIVFANNATNSIYYYSSYMLNAVAPDEAFPVCEVCGAGRVISNPDVLVYNPLTDTSPTCAQVQEAGRTGYVNPQICSVVPLRISDPCGCMAEVTADDDLDNDTTSPPSSSPTKAPTSEAAGHQQALVASAVSGLFATAFSWW
jgi:hypothetical protein